MEGSERTETQNIKKKMYKMALIEHNDDFLHLQLIATYTAQATMLLHKALQDKQSIHFWQSNII